MVKRSQLQPELQEFLFRCQFKPKVFSCKCPTMTCHNIAFGTGESFPSDHSFA